MASSPRRKRKKKAGRARGRAGGDDLSLDERELLSLRMCDLGVRIEGTRLEPRIERLRAEIERRKLRFRPHCWLSEDWFSPDGVPGIAIPFYLAHDRLMQLEYRQMLDVEGGNAESCMRILRHEAGHAIDTAFRLRRRKRWQQVFGKASRKYPEFYRPKLHSKDYVLHLDSWYAQSHPTEDFAETFAVWLKPGSDWRRRYRGWPALRKLEYVDQLMRELAGRKAPVSSREHVDPLSRIKKTLGEYYEEKRARYEVSYPEIYDQDLLRIFSVAPIEGSRRSASAFLRRARAEVRDVVANGTGQHPYIVDQVLDDIIVRCRELGLRMQFPELRAKLELVALLSVQTMNFIHSGRHRVPL